MISRVLPLILLLSFIPFASAHASETHLTADLEGLLGGSAGSWTSVSLQPSVGLLPAITSCTNGICWGGALPIRGAKWSTGSVTTIMPSARIGLDGLFSSRGDGKGLGGYANLDLGYVLSIGGDATVAGLGFSVNAGLRFWFTPTVAVSAGLGASGSPYAPLLQVPIVSGGMAFTL